MRIGLVAAIVAALLSTTPGATASAQPQYGSLSDQEFQQLVQRMKAEPTYLAQNRDLTYRMTTEQWDRMIRSLDLDHFTWVYGVEVSGEEISAIHGEAVDNVSVWSVRDGTLVPIPFQIEATDEDGWAYLEDVSDETVGPLEAVDASDRLVFMYRDTGTEQISDGMHPGAGQVAQELAFEFRGKRRYAYIVTGASERDPVDYVSYDGDTGEADTTFYTFKQRPENILIFEDFRAHAGPTPNHRVLDTVLLDLSTNVFTTWSPRVSIGLHDLQVEILGVKQGPVRDIVLARLNVLIPGIGIPVFRVRTDFTVWDQGIALPVKLNVPAGWILTRALVDPLINIGLDMNDLRGGRFSAAVNPTGAYGRIDGQVDDIERQIGIEVPDGNWLWLDSDRGWNVMMLVNVPPDWPIEARLLYDDAETPEKTYDDLETFPGALPRMGLTVTKIPVGQLNIDLTAIFWFPVAVGDDGPEGFAQAIKNPPTLQTRTLMAGDS